MNIAILVNDITPLAGTERITISLANKLSQKGYVVTIISCNRELSQPGFEVNSSITLGFLNSNTKRESRWKNLFGHFRNIFKLRTFLKGKKYDIIIGQGFPMSMILFPFRKQFRVVICEHTYYNYYASLVRFVRNKIYPHFFRIVVLTEADKREFDKAMANVLVIPNLNEFESSTQANLDSRVLVNVGRLEFEKGVDLLIEAALPILKRHNDWKLCMYGDGSMKQKIKQMISFHGMEDRIILCGQTTDVRSAYLSGSIYVMPSRSEGFGMAIVEAASCGLPIISFNCPNGPKEILSPDLGVLVPELDVKMLGDAMNDMIENRDLRIKYSQKSRAIASKYRPEVVLKDWEKLLGYRK